MQNTTFSGNTAASDGGAIYLTGDLDRLANVRFENNMATSGSGGALYMRNLNSGLDADVVFTANSAGLDGGSVYVEDTIRGDIATGFQESGAGRDGGALYAGTLSGNVRNIQLTGNTAGGDGGALFFGTLGGSLQNVQASGNSSGGSGGAVYAGAMTGAVQDTSFSGNTAAVDGGALYLGGSLSRLANVVFADNTATGGSGGAIHVQSLDSGIGPDVSFTGNKAGLDGGSAYVANAINGDITTSIQDSRAGRNGGAIYAGSITGGVNGAQFSGNSAGGAGGAIYAGTIGSGLANVSFTGNQAGTDGGALSVGSLNGAIVNSTFTGNAASGKGGAIYVFNGGNFSISADAGSRTEFRNNTSHAPGSSVSNNSLYFDGGTANLRVGGAGRVYLYDPLAVGGGSLSFIHDDLGAGGTVYLYSVNEVLGGQASFDFHDGNATFNPDYVLTAMNGSGLNVQLGSNTSGLQERLTMDMHNRDPNLAIINFAGADPATSSFSAGSNVVLIAPRTLLAQVGRYLLVEGGNVLLPTQEEINHVTATIEEAHEYTAQLLLDAAANRIWLVAETIPDTGDIGDNGEGIIPPLEEWLRETAEGEEVLHSDDFFVLKNNIRKVPPEAALSMVWAETRRHVRTAEFALGKAFIDDCNPAQAQCKRDGYALNQQTRMWAGYFGNFSQADDTSEHYGYDQYSHGVLVGVTWDATQNWSLGGYTGYSRARTDFDELSATVDTDTFHAGLYGRYKWEEGFSLTADASYSRHDHEMERNVGGLGNADSDFSQDIFSLGLEAAYDLDLEHLCLTPFLSVRQSWLNQEGFTEKGGRLNTRMDGAHLGNFSTNIGARVSSNFELGKTILRPSLSASWWHDYGDTQVNSRANFLGEHLDGSEPMRFTVSSREHSPDAAILQVGLDTDTLLEGGSSLGFKVYYGLELREDQHDHTVYGGLEFRF